MAIAFPQINPIAISIGPIDIAWYAIAYVIGILAGHNLLCILNTKITPPPLNRMFLNEIISYMIIAIILGGRLGYVFFYHREWLLGSPLKIFKTWEGGMSFHGGLIGVIITLFILCKKSKVNFLHATDLISCVAPIGLGLGRIANFINGELYGRVTDVPWAIIFPYPPDHIPRHPSQLYEAFLEGFLLFIIMLALFQKWKTKISPGWLSGYFLVIYAVFRSAGELFREPDYHLGFILYNMTMGQLLSLPMILLGFYLIVRSSYHAR